LPIAVDPAFDRHIGLGRGQQASDQSVC